MQDISKTVCRKFKDARRALGLTQSALAGELGCHQAALSMFEGGNPTKLSSDFVEKLAARLDIDLVKLLEEDRKKTLADIVPANEVSPGYCPDSKCPSNTAYFVGERTFYRITIQKGIYCAHCGEVLEKYCPSCGAQLNEGACCTMCGKQYVQ